MSVERSGHAGSSGHGDEVDKDGPAQHYRPPGLMGIQTHILFNAQGALTMTDHPATIK